MSGVKNISANFKAIPSIASYELEVIQPAAGLDTKNRFYKAYPGFVYNVRPGVIGGIYPYKHALLTAPPGMTINALTGEINWPSPTEAGSPHAVSLKVTDQTGAVKTVDWTITVTKSGFKFLDAVKGKTAAEGGTGGIDNPWKKTEDWYVGDDEKKYVDEFLYFKNGTYYSHDGMTFKAGYKPMVLMAYPGENPVLEIPFASGINVSKQTPNFYLEGFEVKMPDNHIGIRIQAPYSIIRKNVFHELPERLQYSNNSMVFYAGGDHHTIFQDNEMYNIHGAYGVLGYDDHRVLMEDNNLHDFTNAYGISPKAGIQLWFIRGNRFTSTGGSAIHFQFMNNSDTRNNEVSYNLVRNGAASLAMDAIPSEPGGPLYVHHNTFVGNLLFGKVDTIDGPFFAYNNVIVSEKSGTPAGSHIEVKNSADPSRVRVTDNLVGYPADNIVDADGNLTPKYSEYLGLRGYQLNLDRPAPPTGLRIQ